MKYLIGGQSKKRGFGWKKITLLTVLTLATLASIALISIYSWYKDQLEPVSQQTALVLVDIPSGYSAKQIAELLESKGVIKNATAFDWYVRYKKLRSNLQAGQYQLDSSKPVSDIVAQISQGKVKKDLFTILPGQRLDQIKSAFIKAGYPEEEVDRAFDPNTYSNHPVLAYKPAAASLEGFLFPESYQTTSATTAQDLVKMALDQLSENISKELIGKWQKQGLNPYQAIILASIVEKEVSNENDRRMVAQVFYNRLANDMVLGSDVTYKYIAIITGQEPSAYIDSPYNTRMYHGLPPGPISNVSKSSLEAVANPQSNDYFYFVAGDDGKIYFSKTITEHEALAKEHCKVLCSTF